MNSTSSAAAASSRGYERAIVEQRSPFYIIDVIYMRNMYTQDGLWGLSYEHSSGEAPAIFRIFEELTDKVDAMPPPDESSVNSHLPAPEKLEWSLSELSRNDIREAMTSFDS